jgi:hypothetical protein
MMLDRSVASVVGASRLLRGACAFGLLPCLATCLATCLVLGGCEDRNYPEGFLAEAAKEGPAAGASAAPSAGSEAAAAPMGPGGFNAPGVPNLPAGAIAAPTAETPAIDDATAAVMVETLAAELKLPPATEAPVAAGEEPFQKAARTSRFDSFRSMAARYIQLRAELLPYGRKLADGTASAEERRIHNRLEDAMALEFRRLNAYMWDDRWSEEDRAAMGWILHGGMQPK